MGSPVEFGVWCPLYTVTRFISLTSWQTALHAVWPQPERSQRPLKDIPRPELFEYKQTLGRWQGTWHLEKHHHKQILYTMRATGGSNTHNTVKPDPPVVLNWLYETKLYSQFPAFLDTESALNLNSSWLKTFDCMINTRSSDALVTQRGRASTTGYRLQKWFQPVRYFQCFTLVLVTCNSNRAAE